MRKRKFLPVDGVSNIELFYDLIFVYCISVLTSVMHHVHGGFFDAGTWLIYMFSFMVVLQVWLFTTLLMNRYGDRSASDNICLFINMFLLYFIGEGTRVHWEKFQLQYHIAWGLILINIGVQYFIELRNLKDEPDVYSQTKRMGFVLFAEAALVFITYPLCKTTGVNLVALPILVGIVGSFLHGRRTKVTIVDFTHLSERAMLYVVFTFGEMIIVLAGYFEGGLTASSLYFSSMCFLIVVGLFLSYGTLYDHLIDREIQCNGLTYMALHIVLIFALSLITTSLEFMQNSEADLMPKMILLITSLLMYYVSLFMTLRYSKSKCRPTVKFISSMAATAVSFVVLMLLFRNMMYVNIALTVLYVWGIFLLLHLFGKKAEKTN